MVKTELINTTIDQTGFKKERRLTQQRQKIMKVKLRTERMGKQVGIGLFRVDTNQGRAKQ